MKAGGRLFVYNDFVAENSFVIRDSQKIFARVNKINEQWCVWFYTKHLQENFLRLREALARVEEEYITSYRIANEIY